MAPKSKKPKSKKVSRKSAPKQNLLKTIKSTINNMAETKKQEFGATVFPVTLQPTTPSIVNNALLLTPGDDLQITQGEGQGQRIGNKISIHKAIFKYVICPDEYNATTNNQIVPQIVRLYFMRYKVLPTDTPPLPSLCGGTATVFQGGNTSSGFRGTLQDLVDDINKDTFTLLGVRTHKIGYSVADQTAFGGVSPLQFFSNNDYKLNVIGNIDITKWYPKNILFNDNVDQYAQNLGLFVLIQTIGANGALQGVNKQPLQLDYRINVEYKDF